MATTDDLIALEHAGWDALATSGDAADHYAAALARQVLVVLPGGMTIDDRDEVVRSMSGRRGTTTGSATSASSSWGTAWPC